MPRSPIAALSSSLLLACSIAAQDDPPARQFAKTLEELERKAIAQLRSDDLATAAWGAYAVAEFRLGGCAADVPNWLARLAGSTAEEGASRRAAIALLDALIETGQLVPADELAPFVELGAPVIALMAREPASHCAALLRAFGSGPWLNEKRRACGNLLTGLRDPDFVLHLLRGPWQRWVLVVDAGTAKEDQDPEFVEMTPLSFATGHGRVPAPAAFPPLVQHCLDDFASPNGRLIAPGPKPVFLCRSWFDKKGSFSSSTYGYAELRIARAAWFGRMLGVGQREAIRAIDRPVAIEWKDRAAVDEYARQAAAGAEPTWRALVAACVAAELLTADQAKAPMPAVQVEFADWRTDKTVPLPPSSLESRK